MLTFLLPLSLIFSACDNGKTHESADTGDPREPSTWTVGAMDPNADLVGVEGVAIAFDLSTGERIEVLTGADGTTTVDLIPDQVLSAIAHKDGYSVVWASGDLMRQGIEDYGQFGFFAWELDPATPPVAAELAPVVVSGALLGKALEDSGAVVSATRGGSDEQPEAATSYAVEVQPDLPFTLIGLEFTADPNFPDLDGDQEIEDSFLGWTLVESDGLSQDTVIDLDFEDAATPIALSGSLLAPAGRLATEGAAYITVLGGWAPIGFTPHTWVEEGQTSFGFELEYLSVPQLTLDEHTTYVEMLTNDGLYSAVTLEGALPGSGELDYDLLAPADRISPDGEGPFAWDTLVSWEPVEGAGDEAPYLGLFGDMGQIGAALVTAEESSLALTPLPSTSATLTTGPIYGLTMRCGTLDEDANCEKVAYGTLFELESPLEE